jgi:hypothetical protein
MVKNSDSLEIDQDLAFQRRSWKVQRIVWVLMFLLIVAALLGLLGGSGAFSTTTVGHESGPFRIQYQRFGRFETSSLLRVILTEGNSAEGQVEITVNQEYLDSFEISQVTPPPEIVMAGQQYLTYLFRLRDSQARGALVFCLKPNRIGLLHGEIGLDQFQRIQFTQLIYP